MTTQHHGFSTRSLLILGGLTAAVTSPTTRRKLAEAIQAASGGARSVYQEAQQTYQNTVKPAAVQAQSQLRGQLRGQLQGQLVSGAQELAQVAAERGSELASRAYEQGTKLAEQGGELASKLAGSPLAVQGAQIAASAAAGSGKLAHELLGSVADLREVGGKQTQALLSTAHSRLGEVQSKLSEVHEQVQDRAVQVGTELNTGAAQVRLETGRAVGKGLRQSRKQVRQLEKKVALNAVKVAGKSAIAVKTLEKTAGRKVEATKKQAVKRGKEAKRFVLVESDMIQAKLGRPKAKLGQPKAKSGGLSGLLIAVGLLLGGGVLLARVPALRRSILTFVDSFSPEAAEGLHSAGTSVRDIVGSVWLERIDPALNIEAPAPKASQATGSAAGASTEPGSPAQSRPDQARPDQARPVQSSTNQVTPPQTDSKPTETSVKN